MRAVRWGVGAAVAAAAMVAGAVPAGADTAQPSIAYAGHLVAGPGAATVKITYTCHTDVGPLTHLYVGVKQGPMVDTDEHSSSDFADTFYSTNWKSDAGPNVVNCDGRQHTKTLVLKPQPGFVPKVPRLHSGPALVQLCLFDNVTQIGPDGPVDGGFGFDYTMQQVHAGKGAR